MRASVDRRQFLSSTGLVIGIVLPLGRAMGAQQNTTGAFTPNAFVRIAPGDDTVTVIIKHIEFGQGPATGLTTIVADELDADWSQMRIAFAPANDVLYQNLLMGTMGTGGSTAMANSWLQMRRAGAAARAMLVAAAATRWQVLEADITVSQGVVRHGDRRSRFGELAADAARLPVPLQPKLKRPDQWTLIGSELPKIDSAAKSDGSACYTMDVVRPGMVHAAILHPPAFGARLRAVDGAAAKAEPGVVAVTSIPQGVVVYAHNTFAAMRGRAALKAEWDLSSAETRSSEQMISAYAEAVKTPGLQAEASGDVAAALTSATRTIEATYVFPFLAHGPMEPMGAVIEVRNGRADVWMGSQSQVRDMEAIASVLAITVSDVTLHQQFAGGSFGRLTTPDHGFAIEAANAAKAFPGAPVKFAWTREDDIQGGRYRPIVVHRLKGGIDAAGNIVGWDQVIASQSFFAGTTLESLLIKNGIDNTIVEGAAEGGYAWPNHRIGQHIMPTGVPALWWRSVGNSHSAFAVETFLDELLVLGGKDPVQGRLELLKDIRSKGVLRRAAEMASWGRRPPADHAYGVAVHRSFGSYVAQVAEVSEGTDGLPRVHKVWCAVDCGVAINPNVIRAQMEGGVGYGLGHALYSQITLSEGGRVDQSNFDTYRSLRMSEMPVVEVAIVKSSADPTGVGEPGLPPIAPAVANAWRALTGRAVRRLPFAHAENV